MRKRQKRERAPSKHDVRHDFDLSSRTTISPPGDQGIYNAKRGQRELDNILGEFSVTFLTSLCMAVFLQHRRFSPKPQPLQINQCKLGLVNE